MRTVGHYTELQCKAFRWCRSCVHECFLCQYSGWLLCFAGAVVSVESFPVSAKLIPSVSMSGSLTIAVLQPEPGVSAKPYASSDLYVMPSPGGNPTTWTVSLQLGTQPWVVWE
jgi:hypothetical protein